MDAFNKNHFLFYAVSSPFATKSAGKTRLGKKVSHLKNIQWGGCSGVSLSRGELGKESH